MSILLTATAAWLLAAPPAQKIFIDQASGFQFIHPAAWKVKQSKLKTVFEIPVGKDPKAGRMEVLSTAFHEPLENWNTYQREAVEIGKRRMDRQWQEEILGVPLLLTQSTGPVKSGEETSLTGLLYSMTDQKMFFRLSSSAALFPEVEKQWREAILSLRTTNGELPKPENPDRPKPVKTRGKKPDPGKTISAPVDTRPKPPAKIDVIKPLWDSNIKGAKPDVIIEASAGGSSLNLGLPSGWAAKVDGEKFILSHPKVKGKVILEVLALLDSPDPMGKLEAAANGDIANFDKVTKRVDAKPVRSQAGVKLTSIVRSGVSGPDQAVATYAIGESQNYYWLGTYHAKGEALNKAEATEVDRLWQRLVVAPKAKK